MISWAIQQRQDANVNANVHNNTVAGLKGIKCMVYVCVVAAKRLMLNISIDPIVMVKATIYNSAKAVQDSLNASVEANVCK